MSSIDKLCQIPIYRMLLKPESYLLQNNLNVSVLDLIIQLPNHRAINHITLLEYRTEDFQKKYYESTLLIETKVFCQTLLRNTGLFNSDFEFILNNDCNIKVLFNLLELNKFTFFRYMIVNDVIQHGLSIGNFLSDFRKTENFEISLSLLRSYRLLNRIVLSNQRGLFQ